MSTPTTTSAPRRRLRLYGPSLIMLDLIARQFDGEIEGAHNTMVAALLVPGQECNRAQQESCTSTFHEEEAGKQIREYLNTYVLDKYSSEGDPAIPVSTNPAGSEVHEVEFLQPKTAQLAHSHNIAHFEDLQTYIELSHDGKLAGLPEAKTTRISIFL